MARITRSLLVAVAVSATASASLAAEPLTLDQAVSIALARNRAVIASRLDVQAAEVDRIAATVYRNPDFQYSLANIVLGKGNPQCTYGAAKCVDPGPFDQQIHSFGVTQVLDVWRKRSLRREAAERGIEESRLRVLDAVREVVYAVRSAYADLEREQSERDLARETRDRYSETIRLSRSRFKAGDISENELRKVELEGARYDNAVVDEEMQLDQARYKLASLMALDSADAIESVAVEQPGARLKLDPRSLLDEAVAARPDLLAAQKSLQRATAVVRAERRAPYPDPAVGAIYTYDAFQIAGDNPNTLSLALGFPIPLFDRNQAGIARAEVELRRADNEIQGLLIEIHHEVADATRAAARSQTLLGVFEGGMLEQSQRALQVAEKSYRLGAVSLLEFLEAQRTYIETRGRYLRTLHDYRQSIFDLSHAIGAEVH